MKSIFLFSLLFIVIDPVFGAFFHESEIKGKVSSNGLPLSAVNITLYATNLGTISEEDGTYLLKEVPPGKYRISFSLIGFRSQEMTIDVKHESPTVLNIELMEDLIGLEAIVISATRNEIPIHRSPVIINVMDDRLFSMTQSLSLSEGLSYSPGLRLETNCQNCGFTQVRMNGLDGAYSQILINSRPVFSALAGVYGLDQIPANMIERVEIIRGAGSVLYGGNAIAGTINIITRDPVVNNFEASSTLGIINGEIPDWTTSVNVSVVDEEMKTGISLYALNRQRDYFDANGDGFSEMTKLNNTTFGFNSYYKPSKNSRLGFNLYHIDEYRRGGDGFDVEPHFAEISEELNHKITGGGLNYELSSKDLSNRLGLYASFQKTNRFSYYGGGGGSAYKYLVDNEIFTLGPETDEDFAVLEAFNVAQNAYGRAEDFSFSGGAQYSKSFAYNFSLVAGTEFQSSNTFDKIPGYKRLIDQSVYTLGTYVQAEYSPIERLSLLFGGRFDRVNIKGQYQLVDLFDQKQDNVFNVFVPRFSAMYRLSDHMKFRASYAQGYRAPQAFDEDLHLETIGGTARLNVLGDSLLVERSHSYNISADITHRVGNWQGSFIGEGFYTRLLDPFINANPEELPSGLIIATKRNGAGAYVIGTNLEWRVAISRKLNFQMGATIQEARYDEDESIWEPDEKALEEQPEIESIYTNHILRAPSVYGFIASMWKPTQRFTLNVSGTYTGSMRVLHAVGPSLFPDTESETLFTYTIIRKTPVFFDLTLKLAYDIPVSKSTNLQIFGGVQNAFNSYQKDFDSGPNRDAGYIYGPSRPRVPFIGVKLSYL